MITVLAVIGGGGVILAALYVVPDLIAKHMQDEGENPFE